MRLADTSGGLEVLLAGRTVGRLARTSHGLVAFQYDRDWLVDGYSINPYSLPLSDEVFVPDWQPFDGLFGAFHDSLPDGWGALLLDRKLRQEGIDPSDVDALDRLAIVGSSGRGALTYRPQAEFSLEGVPADLDELARWCRDILDDRPVEDLDAVYAAGGSSGGARPKAFVQEGEGSWIVKFPSSMDPQGIGRLEYEYALAARACGIRVPEVKLYPSSTCEGFFGTRRFDVTEDGGRRHMLSASAIVEVSHRVPALDYESLFQISSFLTGSQGEAKQLFLLMCFNVFAHNRDDHSNNFTWLCDEGAWSLSPAYDLTYSEGMGRQHATSVLGNGNPGPSELLALAKEVGLSARWAKTAMGEVQDRCVDLLKRLGLRS
jgi:serine/threonine-protein kinase HipA